MSVKLELLAQEWHQLKAYIAGQEGGLKEHLKSDWLQVKERYEVAIAHFKERLDRVESELPEGITKQLKGGQSAMTAVSTYLDPPESAEVTVVSSEQTGGITAAVVVSK